MIVEAGWDLMVQWTKAHTAKAPKAKMTAEQKQTMLGNDVADDMLAKKGAEESHGTHVRPRKRDML